MQKVFVAKAGIFSHGHRLRFESGPAPNSDPVPTDLDPPAKGGFQTRRQFVLQAAMLDQKGQARICKPQANEQESNPLQPAAKAMAEGRSPTERS